MWTKLLPLYFFTGFRKELFDDFPSDELRRTKVQFIKPMANGIDGMHLKTFAKARLMTDQSSEFRPEGIRKSVRKRW